MVLQRAAIEEKKCYKEGNEIEEKMKGKMTKKRCLVGILLMLILYVIFTSYSIYMYGNVDEKKKCDTAIVLGAAIWGDKPSPVFEERIKHGVWLYKNDYVKTLIFTGGKGEGKRYSEARIARNYAIEKGVLPKDIYIEEASSITQENIAHAAKLTKDHQLSSVIIVSDPLHMKRAMIMARDYDLEAYTSPTPTSRYTSMKSKLPFFSKGSIFFI